MNIYRLLMVPGLALGAFLATGCEPPTADSAQNGYRGTGMLQLSQPSRVADLKDANAIPTPPPPVPSGGPRAGDVYENVQVLGDLGVAQFTRLMTAMTEWVAPNEGCNYCHIGTNLASDDIYTKVVSRRMLQMTQHINANWTDHVAQTGVTCYTCHRGQNVPANIWFADPGPDTAKQFAGGKNGQNMPAAAAAMASLPYDALSAYLQGDKEIRVIGPTGLPSGHVASIQDTEWTYSLMMHMSTSLGVNCTFCHNTRAMADWSQSTPQRVTSWYGIRMARDLNNDYLDPLQPVYPAHRLGPTGDAPKANCATCHQGVNKPLYGVSMLPDFPALARQTGATASIEAVSEEGLAQAEAATDVVAGDSGP
jgi:photosynthetic reaction center cytochrome c subunit